MTSIINILPDNVINKIAAGEVVERPSSVVKELIENALDAGATDISVDIEQAGKRLIRVSDNGSGMPREDARIAFERHATSKIRSDDDLEAVRTMGFRGEALSSIASVSHVRMTTAERGNTSGVLVELEAGKIKAIADAAAAPGTTLEISHLFFNTPARLKFLKSPATEFSHIATVFSRLAAANPSVRFRLGHNSKTVLDLPAAHSLRERVYQLYGAEVADNLIEFSGGRDITRITGLLSKPGYTRGDKTYQDFYVNSRVVRNATLSHALYAAYSDLLMRDRHPLAFVFLEIDPALVDVNVHPAKTEVRFRNQSQVHDLLRDIVREGLRDGGPVRPDSAALEREGVKEQVVNYLASEDYQGFQEQVPGVGRGTASFFGRLAASRLENSHSSSPVTSGTQSAADYRHPALLQPLAQVHDSFIVAQDQYGMALIDQHAAHERILFEQLQDQYEAGTILQQALLIPIQIEPGLAEKTILEDNLSHLEEIGFVVEDFGGGTFLIKAIPAILSGGDYKQMLSDILDEIKTHGASSRWVKYRDDFFSVMACHPAIKVHRKLSFREMEELLSHLFACRMPHSCPHGRPTIIRFPLDEIKKMFKRL